MNIKKEISTIKKERKEKGMKNKKSLIMTGILLFGVLMMGNLGYGEIKYVSDQFGNLILDGDSKLGIGTTDPGAKLHVEGGIRLRNGVDDPYFYLHTRASDNSGGITFTSNSVNSANQLGGIYFGYSASNLMDIYSNGGINFRAGSTYFNGGTDMMRITNTGVGIGTASPQALLHIKNASSHTYMNIEAPVTGTEAAIRFAIQGINKWGIATLTNDKFAIYNYATSSYDFNIDSAGKVGIGTTSPSPIAKLDVAGSILATKLIAGAPNSLSDVLEATKATYGVLAAFRSLPMDNINPYLSINSSTEGITLESNGSAYKSLMLKTGGYERMRIDSEGNVGIGVANPSEKLTVNGNVKVAGFIRAQELFLDSTVPVADYVFEQEYKLMAISELESFVAKNKHLPNVPSEKEIKAGKGINVNQFQMKLLEKTEENALYLIQEHKTNEAQEKAITQLKKENEDLKQKVTAQIEKNRKLESEISKLSAKFDQLAKELKK